MALAIAWSGRASADMLLAVEGSLAWQSRNEARIPGAGGTRFSIADLAKGPAADYRVYLGYKIAERHELRALYAPFGVEGDGRLAEPVDFAGSSFATGADTQAFYRFNSYRLTYAYHLDPVGDWRFAFGFTAKIRDAEIRLRQGPLEASKKNLGFVPLLNFQAANEFAEDWTFRFDLDGLMAPQGRAFDGALFLERRLAYFGAAHAFSVFGGYRTIEGGANNDEVFNFAWIHKLVFGLRGDF